jgi:hypothetical protein
MVTHRHGQVLSKEIVPLGEQTSLLSLQSQPTEPKLTCDPSLESHSIGETGESHLIVECIPPSSKQTNEQFRIEDIESKD